MKICTSKLNINDVPENRIVTDSIKFEKFEIEDSSIYITRNFSLITIFNENDIILRDVASFDCINFGNASIKENVILLKEPKNGNTPRKYIVVSKTNIFQSITKKMHKLTKVLNQ